MKILLIEDELELRSLIAESLRKERYVVEEAIDYKEALLKIETYKYDCILLDITLPGGSGLDLLNHLKEMHKKENVVIISARDSLEDNIAGLE